MTKLRYALVFVSDMERSVAFYRDVLGWPLTRRSPARTEFAAGGTTLALHHASRPSGAADVQGDLAGRCQLGLWVEDVEAFHQDMVARGTLCIQPPTEDAFGAKLGPGRPALLGGGKSHKGIGGSGLAGQRTMIETARRNAHALGLGNGRAAPQRYTLAAPALSASSRCSVSN